MANTSMEKHRQILLSIGFNVDTKNIKGKLKQAVGEISKIETQLQKNITATERVELNKRKAQRIAQVKSIANVTIASELKTQKTITRVHNSEVVKRGNFRTGFLAKQMASFSTVIRYGVAGVALGFVTSAVMSIVKDALAIEVAMNRVAAITGSAYASMDNLRRVVYETAANFGIAAKDVAKFTIEMAKLGKSNEDIAELAESAAVLASVLGTDLVDSGKLIVTTLNQYGYATSEANRITGVFLKALKESPLAVDDLRTALQYVGAAAAASGIAVEDLGIMLGYLSSRGIRASKIGTGLRNVVLRLAKSGENFYDVMARMKEEGLSLSEALELFGKRGATVAYTLINDWDKVSQQFGKQVPVAIQNTITAMESLATVTGRFKQFWEWLKSAGQGQAAEQSASNSAIIGLIEKSKALGVSFSELARVLTDTMNKWPKKEMSEILKITYRSFEGLQEDLDRLSISGPYGMGAFGIEWSNDMEKFYVILRKERDKEAEALRVSKQISKHTGMLIENITTVQGQEDVLKYIDSGTERDYLFQLITSTLPSDEVWDMIDSALEKTSREIKELDKRTLPELQARLIALRSQMEAQKKTLGIEGADVDYLKQRGKDEGEESLLLKHICQLLTLYSLPLDKDCPGYKGVKDDGYKKVIKNAELYAYEKQLIISKFKEDMSKSTDFRTFGKLAEDFADNLGDDVKAGEIASAEAEAILDGYINETLENLTKSYQEDVQKMGKKYTKLFLLANHGIRSIEDQIAGVDPNDPNADKKIAELKAILLERKTKFEKLRDDYRDDMLDLGKDFKKTHDDISEEGDFLDSLFGDEASFEDKFNKIAELIEQGMRKIADIYNRYQDEMLDQKLTALDEELEAFRRESEAESAILSDQLQNSIISQETFNAEQDKLRKKEIAKENEIAKKEFEATKKRDREKAIIDGIINAVQAFAMGMSTYPMPAGAIIGGAAAALVAAGTIIQVDAINKRKFIPKTFAEGGMVEGPSHDQGGVPFTVQGQSGYEMEGGEYIMPKDITSRYYDLFESIRGNRKHNTDHFATGGPVTSPSGDLSELTTILKQPIRAYITDKELKANEHKNEIIKERTDVWS